MRIKSSAFFWAVSLEKYIFLLSIFDLGKKITPVKNTNKPCKRECRNHFLSLKIFGKSHV